MKEKNARKKRTKWKFSKEAFKQRLCGYCGKILKKDEAALCKTC